MTHMYRTHTQRYLSMTVCLKAGTQQPRRWVWLCYVPTSRPSLEKLPAPQTERP